MSEEILKEIIGKRIKLIDYFRCKDPLCGDNDCGFYHDHLIILIDGSTIKITSCAHNESSSGLKITKNNKDITSILQLIGWKKKR